MIFLVMLIDLFDNVLLKDVLNKDVLFEDVWFKDVLYKDVLFEDVWFKGVLYKDVYLLSLIKMCIVESLLGVHAFMVSPIWRCCIWRWCGQNQ